MKSTVVALVAALVSGTAMYSVGARTSDNSAVLAPATVETVVPAPATRTALQSGYTVVNDRQVVQPRRTTAARRTSQTVVVEETKPKRSWTKTALIIGGSAASGAGVGGAIGGKKGAMTGAAIGGGAASIYEAIRRD